MGLADGVVLSDGVVVLRPWREEDADWYAEAVREPDIQRFTSEPEGLTVEEFRSVIATAHPQVTGFAICDATTGERLGNIGLHQDSTTAEVGYWVAAAARGRGVASRAVRLLSDWALARLGVVELRLWTHPDNDASGRVAEAAGYRRAPEHDQPRLIKGRRWHTIAYLRRSASHDPGEGTPDPTQPAEE